MAFHTVFINFPYSFNESIFLNSTNRRNCSHMSDRTFDLYIVDCSSMWILPCRQETCYFKLILTDVWRENKKWRPWPRLHGGAVVVVSYTYMTVTLATHSVHSVLTQSLISQWLSDDQRTVQLCQLIDCRELVTNAKLFLVGHINMLQPFGLLTTKL